MKRALTAILLLLAAVTGALAQSAPANLPANSVYGRLGIVGDTGPGQAIPFVKLRNGIFPGGKIALSDLSASLKNTLGVSVMDYIGTTGCVPGNYATDCTAAFNAAIAAVYKLSQSNLSGPNTSLAPSGTVHVPASAGCFRIASPITMLQGVSLMGEGGLGSCILADNTDALRYAYIAYYGQAQVSNIFLYGCKWNAGGSFCDPPTAPRTAITRVKAPSPAADDVSSNQMYGLALQNVLIYNFDTAVDVVTVRFFWINNSFFQNVNTCVTFRGFGFEYYANGLVCNRANGDGLGGRGDGLVFIANTYGVGGSVGPEGIKIAQTSIGGFSNSLRIDKAISFTIAESNIQAYVNGIQFTDVTGGLSIRDTAIEVDGTAAHAGIFGQGSGGSGTSTSTNIDSNYLIATGSTSANGIQINETGLFGQHNVNITKNTADGFTGRDIYVLGPKAVTVDGNNLISTGVTNSIELTSSTGGTNFITRNSAAISIVANGSDLTAGNVRKSGNIVAGSVEIPTWDVTTGSTTANRLMLGGGAGAQPTAGPSGTSTQVYHGNNTYSAVANADLANPATTVNGQTCTLGSTCTITAATTNTLTFGTHLTSGGASYNGLTAVTITPDATAANTASTIMARDGSGQVAATTFTGALAGNASTVTTNANLTGDVTSVGNATTLTNAPVIAKVLTGFTSGAGTVSAADSILAALQKINGNVALKQAALTAGQLPGTATNDNASVGNVGEIRQCNALNVIASAATITIASPAVVTVTAHGFSTDGLAPVFFTTTGALPTGITASTIYWTVPGTVTANTFQIATSIANAVAGTSINTSGSQSGVHTPFSRFDLTTATNTNYCALSLPAGDWDVTGTLGLSFGATTNITSIIGSISNTSATLDQSPSRILALGYGSGQVIGNTVSNQFVLPTTRISLSATTTVYAVAQVGFTVSTTTVYGLLRGRRAR